MDLADIIPKLSEPAAYPFAVDAVEVRQTHISVVFLAGPAAYKIRKPVDLGFLDFRTPESRRHDCAEEVRLNRRLAPSVYLGVVPVTRHGDRLQVEGAGEVVEWAVKMERLPEQATLLERLRRGEVTAGLLHRLAERLAAFHASAERGAHVASFGRFDVVAGNARENFAQATPQVGDTVRPAVWSRLRDRTEHELTRLRPLIDDRAAHDAPCDTHGDLHLDHVYFFPERPPPDDLVVIDCVEFNERFRYADPVADMAFLAMDLAFHGRRELARSFADAYFRAARDAEGEELLPFYTAYRAAVRGKVEGFELTEPEVPDAEKAAARLRARAHWLLALTELEPPGNRPCLLLVGGLPGAGKSTLARMLAEAAGFTVIRTDVVRKEIAGPAGPADVLDQGIYTPAWTERTYAQCRRRAEDLLLDGGRVIVDAGFRDEPRRTAFLETATRLAIPALFFACLAPPEIVRHRLAARRGDASDADWSVYRHLQSSWQQPGSDTKRQTREINTDGTPQEALARALAALRRLGLCP